VRLRALRAAVIGEAGVVLALALAGIAGLTTFVAAAGPRVIAAEQVTAVRQALAAAPAAQTGIYASGSWVPAGTAKTPTLTQMAKFGAAVQSQMGSPLSPDAAGSRLWIAGPKLPLAGRKKLATTGVYSAAEPPSMQLSYDSGLAADSTLVAGHLPEAITTGAREGSAADSDALVVQVALTPVTATAFAVHVGSLMDLGITYGNQAVDLEVTGIVRPSPGQFWNSTQVVATPTPPSKFQPYWLGGAVIAQPELMQLQATLWSGGQVQGLWYVPLRLDKLSPALLSPVSAAVTALVAGPAVDNARSAARFAFSDFPQIYSQLPNVLGGIQSQLSAGNGLDEFVIAGIIAAALLLILLCAGLAADRYDAEFSLVRARGGSVGQIARRGFYRALGAAGPGVALGLVLAAVISGAGAFVAIAWVLPAITAVLALASVPARTAWRARRPTMPRGDRQTELARPRRSGRRVVAELTVVLAGLAAVVALELRGLASGTDALALASPLLVAAAASIAIARLYPLPVRALLPLATRGRGPVGFLGLARAGRASPATILPALALVLTMTLAAFGWMMERSATAGQVTTSWQQTGADAIVTAAGNNVISPSDQAAFDKVPGVTRTALVYTTTATSVFAATLFPLGNVGSAAGLSFNTGLLVADPAQYAAVAARTPWPRFPASALSKRSGPVPILISTAAAGQDSARAFVGARQVLELDGIDMQVVVAGTISATPAFPSRENYVVLPQWAVGQFPSIAGMTTLLATGPSLSAARLTAVATSYVPGGQVVLRSQVLHGLRTSATEYAVQLFTVSIWASAALSVVALMFGLAATAGSRKQLRSRMTAMGMSSRQAGALALTDTIPLLVIAILGTAAAGAALVLVSRSVVNLAPLTGAGGAVGVTLTVPALIVPAAAVIVLALGAVAFEHWRATRAESATALRTEEAW
jgi:putative ABC transport system permease protein